MEDESANGQGKADPKGGRNNSLFLITQRFVELIRSKPNKTLEINVCAAELGVKKRRVYDITNVLEGINVVAKSSKNNIQWIGPDIGADDDKKNEERMRQIQKTKSEIDELLAAETNLDRLTAQMAQKLKAEKEGITRLAVAKSDISSLECYRDKVVFAIHAPPGAEMTIPLPLVDYETNKKSYQLYLQSKDKPVEIYVVNQGLDTTSVANFTSAQANEGARLDELLDQQYVEPPRSLSAVHEENEDSHADNNQQSPSEMLESFSSRSLHDGPHTNSTSDIGGTSSTIDTIGHAEAYVLLQKADAYVLLQKDDECVGNSFDSPINTSLCMSLTPELSPPGLPIDHQHRENSTEPEHKRARRS